MQVGELTDNKHPYIYKDDLATKARRMICENRLSILPVLETTDKKLIGVINREDLMWISASKSTAPVGSILSEPKLIVSPGLSVENVLKQMLKFNLNYIPTVDSLTKRKYLGILGLENYISILIKKHSQKLKQKTSSIMVNADYCCSPDDYVDKVWVLMKEKAVSSIPVIKDGKIIGIVSEGDLLCSGRVRPTFESKKGRFKIGIKISNIMTTPPVKLSPYVRIERAAKIIHEKKFFLVPVVNKENEMLGAVDRKCLVKLLL